MKATQAAAKYLKTLHGMFEDWHLAMASYNGGPGRVKRALTRSRKNDFWQLTSTTRYLPRETRDYVPMILAAVIIAKNPAQYGFDIVPMPSTPTETVIVPPALDLRRVAEWAGVPMDDIQKLNPEFRRWTTPVKKGEYTIRVPEGTAERREGRPRGGGAGPAERDAVAHRQARRNAGDHRQEAAASTGPIWPKRITCASTRAWRPAIALVIPRMPSAALLARASTATTDVEKTAEAIVADVLDGNRGGGRRAVRGADLSRALRRHALRHRQAHRHHRHSVEELEQAARDQPEDRNAAPDPVAAFRQHPIASEVSRTSVTLNSRSCRRRCWRGGT